MSIGARYFQARAQFIARQAFKSAARNWLIVGLGKAPQRAQLIVGLAH